jgi:hypothetical protein
LDVASKKKALDDVGPSTAAPTKMTKVVDAVDMSATPMFIVLDSNSSFE